jgi:integrase
MMVFRSKGRKTYKVRVTDLDGNSATLSTGTSDAETAKAVAAMVSRFKSQRRRNVLASLAGKRVPLARVFDAYEEGDDALDRLLEQLTAIDLSQMVDEWGKHAPPKYVKQVRQFIPKGQRFPVSRFRRGEISQFLAGLEVSGSTKNRYKAALSVFAKWLVEREVIETNVVRDVSGYKPNEARLARLEREQAKVLLRSLSQPYRALEAVMAGSGVEWQAIERAHRRDFDLEKWTFHAHGGKNRYRNRIVRITEQWARPAIRQHLETLGPNARAFEGITEWGALRIHKKASEELRLPETTLHDWRHSYAVNNLRDGMRPQVVKRQLGHAPNSTLLERVYGVWIVTDADYPDEVISTGSATTQEIIEEITSTGARK